jgi:hypothetical protein
MPFGKYAGVPLSDVPPDYLRWLYRSSLALLEEIEAVLGDDIRTPAERKELAEAQKLSNMRLVD